MLLHTILFTLALCNDVVALRSRTGGGALDIASEQCRDEWKGLTTQATPKRLDIVVSHCESDLKWLSEEVEKLRLQGMEVGVITVYSKCGVEPTHAPKGAILRKLPNIGRCDHTYALHMAEMVVVDVAANPQPDVVLFTKDKYWVHSTDLNTTTFSDVVRRAVGPAGFGCLLVPSAGYAAYHRTQELLNFHISGYTPRPGSQWKSKAFRASEYANMGVWAKTLGIKIPSPIAPVCYGGYFAASRGQIQKNEAAWKQLEQSLSVGDNIEEGHFAERSWAALLTHFDSSQFNVMSKESKDMTTLTEPSRQPTLFSRMKDLIFPEAFKRWIVGHNGRFGELIC